MARLFGDRRVPLRVCVPADIAPRVADMVEIGMPARAVTGASLFAYLPLLTGVVGGAVAGSMLAGDAGGDGAAIAGAAGGLLLAFAVLRLADGLSRRLLGEPTVVRILPSE